MPSKRKKKKSRIALWVLFAATPFAVWLLAFLVWFYWTPLGRLLGTAESRPKFRSSTARPVERKEASAPADERQPRERITDEERGQLDDILTKRRGRE